MVKVKLHTYIGPLEVCGHLICGMLYITSPAGLLHPTLVWRFQEATYIPMRGGALTRLPSNAMALLVLIYTWLGWSRSYLSLTLVSLEPATSHIRSKNYTIAPPRLDMEALSVSKHVNGSTSVKELSLWDGLSWKCFDIYFFTVSMYQNTTKVHPQVLKKSVLRKCFASIEIEMYLYVRITLFCSALRQHTTV